MERRVKISFHLIVKNEEKNIIACFDSFKGVYDELIVVDTGSTDKTKELCEKYTDNIFDFAWIDDFAAARNFALEKCSGDVIGWTDLDDRLVGDPMTFRHLLEERLKVSDVIDIPYIYDVAEGKASLQYNRRRFWKKGAVIWEGRIHEYPKVISDAKITSINEFSYLHCRGVNTDSDRNIRILENIVKEGHPTPRDLFYYGKELCYRQRLREAALIFLRYIEVSNYPDEKHRAMYELALCFYSLGDKVNAKKWALKAIDLNANYCEPYTLVGRIYGDAWDWANARAWFQHAIDLPPPPSGWFDYVPERTYIPLEWLAIAEYRLGHHDQAREAHKRAKNYNPENPWLITNDKWFGVFHPTDPWTIALLDKKRYDSAKISILCPCRMRPEGLARLYHTALVLADRPDLLEFLAAVEEDDPLIDRYKLLTEIPQIYTKEKTSSAKLNSLAKRATGDLLWMAMDDMTMETRGWDTLFRSSIPADGIMVSYPDDQVFCSCTHPLISRDMYESVGYFAYPELNHDWIDTWWEQIGIDLARITFLKDVKLKHYHYISDVIMHDHASESLDSPRRLLRNQAEIITKAHRKEQLADGAKLFRRIVVGRGLEIISAVSKKDLVWLADKVSEANIALEIGADKGRSSLVMGVLCKKQLITIDPFQNEFASSFPEFQENLKDLLESSKVRHVGKTSDQAVEELEELRGTVDLLFIDGDHSYEQVLRDLKNYVPFVREKGIICGHDYPLDGVHKAVNEFFKTEVHCVEWIWYTVKQS